MRREVMSINGLTNCRILVCSFCAIRYLIGKFAFIVLLPWLLKIVNKFKSLAIIVTLAIGSYF